MDSALQVTVELRSEIITGQDKLRPIRKYEKEVSSGQEEYKYDKSPSQENLKNDKSGCQDQLAACKVNENVIE
jgi:hypothetical protein